MMDRVVGVQYLSWLQRALIGVHCCQGRTQRVWSKKIKKRRGLYLFEKDVARTPTLSGWVDTRFGCNKGVQTVKTVDWSCKLKRSQAVGIIK